MTGVTLKFLISTIVKKNKFGKKNLGKTPVGKITCIHSSYKSIHHVYKNSSLKKQEKTVGVWFVGLDQPTPLPKVSWALHLLRPNIEFTKTQVGKVSRLQIFSLGKNGVK